MLLQVDIIVSNCVVNLSPDKARVLAEAYRVLRPGGEFYFSNVYSDRRVAEEAQKDEVCLHVQHHPAKRLSDPANTGDEVW